MQLRNLQIPTGAVFAPMAGLTDAACRHLMADHGAAWTVSEMASAKALNFGDRKSLELLKDEHPHGLYAIQLFGAEPESMAKAILFVREKVLDYVKRGNIIRRNHPDKQYRAADICVKMQFFRLHENITRKDII